MSGVRLRGHHLICLRFFAGEGYSEEYRANLRDVVGRAANGEPVLLVRGADDVCAACEHMAPGRCPFEADAHGEIARLDRLAERLLQVTPGQTLDYGELGDGLRPVLSTWRRDACERCEWLPVCTPSLNAATDQGPAAR